MRAETAIRQLADRQLHLVTRRQLLDAGFSASKIGRQVTSGRLCSVQPGVYLTAGRALSDEQRALAACFACGEGSCVSGPTAAALWGYIETISDPIVVTVPLGRNPRIKGIRVHRRRLDRIDKTTKGPIPITTPPRTLLDVAAAVDRNDLERVTDRAFRVSTLTPDRLLAYLKRPQVAHCRGIAELRAVATDRSRSGVPDSDLENDAIRLLRTYNLPPPVRQFRARAYSRNVRFDLAYPDERLAIELDGRAPHWGRDAWQSDHDRDNATELGDWRVLRFTWWDVHERPLYFVVTVATALRLRPRGWMRDRSTKVGAL